MTFLAAGHETTAAALGWSIYELCRSPDLQKVLCQEITKNVPARCFDLINEGGRGLKAEYIDQCTHLQAFCAEILRLYPPVAITSRVAARDTTLLEHLIPKGTVIFLAPWAVNVSTALWGPDAKEFKPERFLNHPTALSQERKASSSKDNGDDDAEFTNPNIETGARRQESAYANLTFLHGPRSCVGQSFARGELACLVAAWVTAFETSFSKPLPTSESERVQKAKKKAGFEGGVYVMDGASAMD